MMYARQNEPRSLRLIKASVFCTKAERFIKIMPATLSLSVCLLGIFNQYFEFMEPLWLAGLAATIIIVDGVLLYFGRIVQMWSASIMDMYDTYVYGIPANELVTKQISEVTVANFSASIRDKTGNRFKNYYFKCKADTEKQCAIFENQRKQFVDEHNFLLFCRIPLYVAWIGFLIALLIISATMNDTFVNTVANIFIPSLGVIMLIINSWILFEENLRDLKRFIIVLEKKRQEYASGNSADNLNSPLFLRSVQDAVHNFRAHNFSPPNTLFYIYSFLQRRRARRMAKLGLETDEFPKIRKRSTKKKTTPKTARKSK